METRAQRILGALQQQPGAICDDCLPQLAGLRRRQDAFMVCTQLAAGGSISRTKGACSLCQKVKAVNCTAAPHTPPGFAEIPNALQGEPMPPDETPATLRVPAGDHDAHNWYWDGNVQSRLVTWMAQNGYHIRQVANTATREAGIDVIATTPAGQELLVSVKGFPERTERTTSPTQARHWFSGGMFDLVLYRNEHPNALLGLALPEGFKTYANLAQRTQWLRESMPFTIFWIGETGDVRAE